MKLFAGPDTVWKDWRLKWQGWRAAPGWAAAYLLVSLIIFGINHWKLVRSWLPHHPVCDSTQVDAVSAPWLYTRVLHWANRPAHSNVVTVFIPENLPEIHQNVCNARLYLSDVLLALRDQRPALVVVDKSFSQHVCSANDDDKPTATLVQTLSTAPFPVIVGRSARAAEPAQQRAGVCLCQDAGLSFGPNVKGALLRPNADLAKIPLQWRGVTAEHPDQTVYLNTLALEALRTFAPNTAADEDFRSMLFSGRAPYANLIRDRFPISTVDLLCTDNARRTTGDRWAGQCARGDLRTVAAPGQQPQLGSALLGRVVLIGAQGNHDQVTTLNQEYWGYELQAIYINALITGSYLLAPPVWALLTVYGFYILLNAVLFPPNSMIKARHPGRWFALTAVKLLLVLGITCGCVAVFLLFHCLPPLDASLLFIPAVLTQFLVQVQQGSDHHVKKHGREAARAQRPAASHPRKSNTADTQGTA